MLGYCTLGSLQNVIILSLRSTIFSTNYLINFEFNRKLNQFFIKNW